MLAVTFWSAAVDLLSGKFSIFRKFREKFLIHRKFIVRLFYLIFSLFWVPFFRVCNIYNMRKMWKNARFFFIVHVFYKVCSGKKLKKKFICQQRKRDMPYEWRIIRIPTNMNLISLIYNRNMLFKWKQT